MSTMAPGHVFVGVDGSLAGLRALRRGVEEARLREQDLYVVHARQPARNRGFPSSLPSGHPSGHYASMANHPSQPAPGEWMDKAAMRVIVSSIQDALGSRPADVGLHCTIAVGRPAAVLSSLGWRDEDLLVIGTDNSPRRHHPLRRSISRYCVTHSRCPVLVVPPDSFSREMEYELNRRFARRDVWKQFDGVSGHADQRHFA